MPHEGVEVDHLSPVLRSIENHGQSPFEILRLREREHIRHLVERPQADKLIDHSVTRRESSRASA